MPVFSQKFIGVTLPIRLGQTGMFEQSIDIIEQTRSNVKNLILTKKGERLNQPRLGCDIWKILFEQITPETIEAARISVIESFNEFLPYLELVDFNVQQILPNENLFTIKIVYRFLNNPNVVDTVTVDNLTNKLTTQEILKRTTRTVNAAGITIRGTVRGTATIPPGSLG